MESDKKTERRGFLEKLGLGSVAVLSVFGMGKFLFPTVSLYPSRKFKIGKVNLSDGELKMMTDRQVVLKKTPEGLAAISLVCTHLGCIINKEETEFSCPCHGSRFDFDGNVTQGPAPSPLKWYKISAREDGSLEVDGGKTVTPGTFFVG